MIAQSAFRSCGVQRSRNARWDWTSPARRHSGGGLQSALSVRAPASHGGNLDAFGGHSIAFAASVKPDTAPDRFQTKDA